MVSTWVCLIERCHLLMQPCATLMFFWWQDYQVWRLMVSMLYSWQLGRTVLSFILQGFVPLFDLFRQGLEWSIQHRLGVRGEIMMFQGSELGEFSHLARDRLHLFRQQGLSSSFADKSSSCSRVWVNVGEVKWYRARSKMLADVSTQIPQKQDRL